MSTTITRDEWLAEFERITQQLAPQPDGHHTTAELAEAMNVSDETVKKMLRRVHAEGRLSTSRRRATRIDGCPCNVPVYKLKPEAKPEVKTRKQARE